MENDILQKEHSGRNHGFDGTVLCSHVRTMHSPGNRRDFISDSSWECSTHHFVEGEMRRTALFTFVAIVAATLTADMAMATGSIHSSWEAFYGFGDANPVDDSLTDAGSTECQLCHLESNGLPDTTVGSAVKTSPSDARRPESW